MPLVNVRIPEGSLSQRRKDLMIKKITDAVVEAEGYEQVRNHTWVIIDEVKEGNWGVGGSALTVEEMGTHMNILPGTKRKN
jgi:4-oxalocrotonate tautomerase